MRTGAGDTLRRLVGRAEGRHGEILAERSGTCEVYVVPAVEAHYRAHRGQFDVEAAETMLARVLADPLWVCQGRKASTTVVVEESDQEHYLVVPVKSLPGENWLETLFVESQRRFARREWVREGLLHKRR